MTVLTPAHRQSECFRVLELRLREELEILRTRLETRMEPAETDRLRGKIEGIRFVLSLGKERVSLPPESSSLGF